VLVSVTSAPPIAAPEASLTVPEIEPKVDCPRAVKQLPSNSTVARMGNQDLCEITAPPKNVPQSSGPDQTICTRSDLDSELGVSSARFVYRITLANSAVALLYRGEIDEGNEGQKHT
jgi:hypothetical protein